MTGVGMAAVGVVLYVLMLTGMAKVYPDRPADKALFVVVYLLVMGAAAWLLGSGVGLLLQELEALNP